MSAQARHQTSRILKAAWWIRITPLLAKLRFSTYVNCWLRSCFMTQQVNVIPRKHLCAQLGIMKDWRWFVTGRCKRLLHWGNEETLCSLWLTSRFTSKKGVVITLRLNWNYDFSNQLLLLCFYFYDFYDFWWFGVAQNRCNDNTYPPPKTDNSFLIYNSNTNFHKYVRLVVWLTMF